MTDAPSSAITRLVLTDVRNYQHLKLDFAQPLVALVGDNGVGKTNILEAISLLSAGRGLRRAALAAVARQDGPGNWAIAATIADEAGETAIGTGYTSGDSGRRVRINGEDARTSEALLDHLRVLWLVPAMDGLFTGPASDRRRFLDRLTLSLDAGHGRRVADFEKALRQRNRLLEEGGSSDYLNAIETQVAGLGVAVAAARSETISLLSSRLRRQQESGLPFPTASLTLEGPYEDLCGTANALDQEDRYLGHLADNRYRDRAAGRTLTGPHRTDLIVRHLEKEMPAAHSSTGEQKALLVGLILAHAELTASVSGLFPVLLLDEIAAHLDPGRRRALFARLSELGTQAFMTGTDPELFAAMPESSEIFRVSDRSAELL